MFLDCLGKYKTRSKHNSTNKQTIEDIKIGLICRCRSKNATLLRYTNIFDYREYRHFFRRKYLWILLKKIFSAVNQTHIFDGKYFLPHWSHFQNNGCLRNYTLHFKRTISIIYTYVY